LRGCSVGIFDGEEFMKYDIKMSSDSMVYIPSNVKIVLGVQAILRFYLNKLRGCSVNITDGRDLWNTTLRVAQVS
jgi:hypothetical protein